MRRLGLVGGSGLDDWAEVARSHEMSGIYGEPSAKLAEFCIGNLQLFFLPRHGNHHEIPPHAVNYRANIDAFKRLEVEGIIAVNAVGSISADVEPGMLVVPDQLIDYTWGRVHSFSMTSSDSLSHTEFAAPFDGNIRSSLIDAASRASVKVLDGGCIGVTQGPRLETAAEIRRLKRDGCDLVGMTTMPESALAREMALDYASLCVSANWAAGLETQPVTMAGIEDTLATSMVNVRSLLSKVFEEFNHVS
jgi:5'-methylthioinosine phosphorylase